MRTLTRITDSLFVFVDSSIPNQKPIARMGPRLDVALYMVKQCDYDRDEVALAMSELVVKDNDVAHFGMLKRFMYTIDFQVGEVRGMVS